MLIAICLGSYLENNQLVSPFPAFLQTMPSIVSINLQNNHFVRVSIVDPLAWAAIAGVSTPNLPSVIHTVRCARFQCGVIRYRLEMDSVLLVVRSCIGFVHQPSRRDSHHSHLSHFVSLV